VGGSRPVSGAADRPHADAGSIFPYSCAASGAHRAAPNEPPGSRGDPVADVRPFPHADPDGPHGDSFPGSGENAHAGSFRRGKPGAGRPDGDPALANPDSAVPSCPTHPDGVPVSGALPHEGSLCPEPGGGGRVWGDLPLGLSGGGAYRGGGADPGSGASAPWGMSAAGCWGWP
jgi:hypothetical protein